MSRPWQTMAFSDAVEVNPRRPIARRTLAPFVDMASLPTKTREVRTVRTRTVGSGGSTFANGDTLFARITPCTENGKTGLVSRLTVGEVATGSTEFIVLGPRQKITIPQFVYYLAKNPTFRSFAISRMRGTSGRQRVPVSVFDDFEVCLPPLPEQCKIVAILSSVEDAIEKTQAVIEQVQVVKRGLMQQLLTRGLPGRHTRFKQTEIGEIPEEWECAQLGCRAELQPGFAFKSKDFSVTGDRLIRGSNVGVGGLKWTDDNTKYFPSARRIEVRDYVIREGDIVVAMDRPFITDGFKIARVTAEDMPALLLQRVGRFRRYREVTPEYLWYLLQSRYIKTHLQVNQKGTDLPHISKTEIESSFCPFPPVREQQQIAMCLDSLEGFASRLELEQRQVSMLRLGLVSVLLTGELRVTPDSEAP